MSNILRIRELAEKVGMHNLSKGEFNVENSNMNNLDFLEMVMTKELEIRERKRIDKFRHEASLPKGMLLEDYDLDFNSNLSRFQLNELIKFEWLDERYNILITGGTGVGKTHLATGLAIKAIEQDIKVFYTTVENLIYLIKTKEIVKRSKTRIDYIKDSELLVLDEVGYLPMSKEDSLLLFKFINQVNQTKSLIVITNRELSMWDDIFYDELTATTIVDRLIQNCQILNLKGESYRLAKRKKILR